jgi:hypothetical protein
VGDPVIRAEVSVHVAAPVERVRALYAAPEGWARLFPATIRGARVVRRSGDETEIEVDHVEGPVRNVLRQVSPARLDLEERKRRYDATFTNEFLPEGRGTRYVLRAAVRLRWPYRLLAPFVKPLVVARMRRYVVEPLRAAAEAAGGS